MKHSALHLCLTAFLVLTACRSAPQPTEPEATAERSDDENEAEADETVAARSVVETVMLEEPHFCRRTYTEDGTSVAVETVEFDERGLPVRIEAVEEGTQARITTFEYDLAENVVRRSVDRRADGDVDRIEITTYDQHGNPVEIVTGDPERPMTTKRTYDESGERLLREEVIRGETLLQIHTYEYNQAGDVAEIRHYRSPQPEVDASTEMEPRSIETFVYDAGKLVESNEEEAQGTIIRTSYDERERKIGWAMKGENAEEFERAQWWTYGEGPDPVYERTSASKCATFEYDEAGRLRTEKRFRGVCGESGVEEGASPEFAVEYDYECDSTSEP